VLSGHIVELYEYEKPASFGYQGHGGRKPSCESASDREEENRRLTTRRARENIRRLSLMNFSKHSKFITLTFEDNLTDVKEANGKFKAFIRKLRTYKDDFKYISVIEFQERGAVHYHMISNLPYIKNSDLRKIWGHGFVKINDIKHVDNIGAYMVKYMLKDVSDKRLCGLKSYLTSRGLTRSQELRGDVAEKLFEVYKLDKIEKVFTNSYESEHHGQITYSEFNSQRK